VRTLFGDMLKEAVFSLGVELVQVLASDFVISREWKCSHPDSRLLGFRPVGVNRPLFLTFPPIPAAIET
jgi:hypothetical protein